MDRQRMNFEEIPGVGSKTAEALAELPDAEAVLRSGDVATLASVSGIPEGRAARIARAAIRAEHDDPGGFLATDRARGLYRDVLGLFQERAVTTYGKKRLETFYPSPVASRIEEARTYVAEAVERDPDPDVLDALDGVEPLQSPRTVAVRDRCLATTDAETYAEARTAVPELSVEIVEDTRQLADLARGYSTVVALDEAFAGVEVDGEVRIEPDALSTPESIVPERTLAFYAANRDRLQAAAAVHRAAGLDPPLDLDTFEAAIERIAADGSVAGDEEVDRLTAALDDLDAFVSSAEKAANDRLREAIEERDVTIEGADLLTLVERGAGVDSLLSRELAEEYAEAVASARTELLELLDLAPEEAEVARMAFPDEPTFPVEHDEGVIARLREDLSVARDRREASQKIELAEELADERENAEHLVRAALELDVELAIARFTRDFAGVLPQRGGSGFEIEGGRSPLLDVSFDAVEPVDYAAEGVALLSGVNSGGKTSLLDLIAICTILAHMGMPVPAERMTCKRFEELHYHEKTQGTLDAGAFEATLRGFGALTDGEAERLVLVDELESITEPGASATIIAGILEELREQPVTGVFVSHLAGEIRDAADVHVPVDGIEAVGLVDGELQVNRSPVKDHLARSTPELIVEKLAEEGHSEFYGRLLEKFEEE